MKDYLLPLLALALLATLAVLVIGVVGMARGGDFNKKHSNHMMRLRVILQGTAVLLLAAAMYLAGD